MTGRDNPDERERPFIYDADGKRIYVGTADEKASGQEVGPQPRGSSRRPPAQLGMRGIAHGFLRSLSRSTRSYWRLALAFGLPGILIGIWLSRPIFSVESVGAPPGDMTFLTANIKLGGAIPASDIFVWCIVNRVVSERKYGLEIKNIHEQLAYRLSKLDTGDTFPVRCPMTWSLAIDKNGRDAYWVYGSVAPGGVSLAIHLSLVNGQPDKGVNGLQKIKFADLQRYEIHDGTDIDGTIMVQYKWRYLYFRQAKSFRVIGHLSPSSPLMEWRAVPANDSPIAGPDFPGGFDVEADGPKSGFLIVTGSDDQVYKNP